MLDNPWRLASLGLLLVVFYQNSAASVASVPADATWLTLISSLWGFAFVVRSLVLIAIAASVPYIYRATKLPRAVSLTHWAGAILAHRGYRSEAQQSGKILSTSKPGSRRHSRAGSRDDAAPNPLAASALLTAQTIGGTPRAVPSAGPPGLPLANGTVPNRSRASSMAGNTPRPAVLDAGNYNIPENSMLAFIYAHEQGVHGVEVDVAMTKDKQILVMHDNTLERTMDGSGELCEYTLEQIHQMKYRPVTNQEYVIRDPRNRLIDCSKAPTLEQVIIFCKERNLKLMIETKEYVDHNLLRSKICALFDKYAMHSWSFVATFNPWHLYWYRREFPLIPTCLLYCRTCTEWSHQDASKEMLLPSMINYEATRKIADWLLFYFSPTFIADYLGVAMVGPHNILISPALITSLTTRGIVCDVWVVNTELEKVWLKSLGCVVTSDRLFTLDDVSPFEPVVDKAAPPTPSIHAAEDFLNAAYYSNNPESTISPVTPDSESDDDDEQPLTLPTFPEIVSSPSPSSLDASVAPQSSDSDLVLIDTPKEQTSPAADATSAQ